MFIGQYNNGNVAKKVGDRTDYVYLLVHTSLLDSRKTAYEITRRDGASIHPVIDVVRAV